MKIKKEDIQIAEKFLHYKNNPIEFIENFIYLPITGESKLFKLYDKQKDVVHSFLNDNYLILLKSRQIGMSTVTQAIITYLCVFYKNCVIGIISRDREESSDFCNKVQNMIDSLPSWLRPEYKNKAATYFRLKNGCELHVSAVSPTNPSGVFRGKTITLLILDEAAFIRYADECYTAVAPSLAKAHQVARQNNIPFGTIIISTPNKSTGIGEFYYKTWVSALNGDNIFVPHRVKWDEIPEYRDDPNWYSNQCRILGGDERKIAQELNLEFVGSDSSLFDRNTQSELQKQKPKALEEIRIKGHDFAIWRMDEINRNDYYIIGVDVASGAGTDYSTIEVMNYKTMNQVMEYKGKIEPLKFTEVVRHVCKIVPKNIIIVENTGGYGLAILNELYHDLKYNFNLYGEWRLRKNKKGSKEFIPGLSTNNKTRPLIVDALHNYVSEDPSIVKSHRLATELLGLTNKSAKIEADRGFNDDLAMAFAFCCYVRKYENDIFTIRDESGDIVSLIDDEFEDMESTLKIIRDGNNGSPFKYDREKATETGNVDVLNKSIEEYIKNSNLTGEINIHELWK